MWNSRNIHIYPENSLFKRYLERAEFKNLKKEPQYFGFSYDRGINQNNYHCIAVFKITTEPNKIITITEKEYENSLHEIEKTRTSH